jgi:hypothetical protein
MTKIADKTLISEESPLGEIIDTLVLLENYGAETGKIFTVDAQSECTLILLSMFNFKNIKLLEGGSDSGVPAAPRNKTQNALWTHFKHSNKEILLPSYLHPTGLSNENTLLQFDSRSARGQSCGDGSTKTPMKKWEMKRAVKKWGKEPMFLIGGQDTKDYLPGVALKRGRLPQLINEMNECRFFLGACSGMAHLAGLLRKPGVVVTLFGHDRFKFFYNRMFPSIECHSRKELMPKLS